MSADHEFYLVDRNEIDYDEEWKLGKTTKPSEGVLIHDDLLGYLLSTLVWIPTYNPSRKEARFGLCRYGPTVIKLEGALLAQQLFQSWATLLALGPPSFYLPGPFSFNDEHPDGYYSRLTIHRDEFVSKLNQLASYAEQIVESNGRYYILHRGI